MPLIGSEGTAMTKIYLIDASLFNWIKRTSVRVDWYANQFEFDEWLFRWNRAFVGRAFDDF